MTTKRELILAAHRRTACRLHVNAYMEDRYAARLVEGDEGKCFWLMTARN